ncbi:peptidoglycan DD-metalloendopeptidase family protein [Alkalibacillus sp. S2W]|uniref:peptidoglycan DD-metalloendopeptidase family protein n=1 Tax=Alkalibacillus sp. S2W TaxID=3386553 RepID=UPI00398CA459
MNKRVEKIREDIAKRKLRERKKLHQHPNMLPSNEEMHGMTSIPQSDDFNWTTYVMSFLRRGVLALALFLGVLLLSQSNSSWANQVDSRVDQLLTDDLPFATVQAWYDAHIATMFVSTGFDAPVNEPSEPNQAMLVNGLNENQVTSMEDHLLVEITEEQTIHPIEKGTVLFAGNKEETGKTIVVQHEDGSETVYGHLSSIDVFHYQFVGPSDTLGSISHEAASEEASLYFAVENHNESVDPVPVILGR